MNGYPGSPPIFREVQQFRQPWIWILIFIVSLFSIYAMLEQLVLGRPVGNNPMPDKMLLVLGPILAVALPVFFYLIKMVTEVRADGIYVRFFPLHRFFVRIAFRSLRSFKALTYRPILDYGGWGIRYTWKGKAYNVSGNRGVKLEMENGKSLLIGSQRAEDLARAIEEGIREGG